MGAAVKETKADRNVGDGLVISQCYFALPVVTEVVTIRLVERAGEDETARSPRQVWQETFARGLERAGKRKKSEPERVPNLGDEAFWQGGPERGTLRVEKGSVLAASRTRNGRSERPRGWRVRSYSVYKRPIVPSLRVGSKQTGWFLRTSPSGFV